MNMNNTTSLFPLGHIPLTDTIGGCHEENKKPYHHERRRRREDGGRGWRRSHQGSEVGGDQGARF
jgi:hypothetical protein